jgi:hypothetical protein
MGLGQLLVGQLRGDGCSYGHLLALIVMASQREQVSIRATVRAQLSDEQVSDEQLSGSPTIHTVHMKLKLGHQPSQVNNGEMGIKMHYSL